MIFIGQDLLPLVILISWKKVLLIPYLMVVKVFLIHISSFMFSALSVSNFQ